MCGEPLQCYTEKIKKARKNHKCCECNNTIVPGEQYQFVSGLRTDGKWIKYNTCMGCVEFIDYLMGVTNERCYEFGSLWEIAEDSIHVLDKEDKFSAFRKFISLKHRIFGKET